MTSAVGTRLLCVCVMTEGECWLSAPGLSPGSFAASLRQTRHVASSAEPQQISGFRTFVSLDCKNLGPHV